MKQIFETDNYYLVKRIFSSEINLIKIIAVTEKTYYVQWNNGNYSWELQEELNKYFMIENITEQYPYIHH